MFTCLVFAFVGCNDQHVGNIDVSTVSLQISTDMFSSCVCLICIGESISILIELLSKIKCSVFHCELLQTCQLRGYQFNFSLIISKIYFWTCSM